MRRLAWLVLLAALSGTGCRAVFFFAPSEDIRMNPGDPGTYYGSDNQWYGPDGTPLANQGRNPNAAAPAARVGGVTAPGPTAAGAASQNATDPATTTQPAATGGGVLAPYGAPPPAFPNIPAFQPPPAYVPGQFTAPTIADALNDPGYQFRTQQGEDALQRWAAAKGTLNDSGTAKALIDYGQNAAEQGYGNVYARDFGTFQANQTAAADAYKTNYGTQYVDPYQINRQTQYLDPWTAAYNTWKQQGANYLQNQGTAANTALSFGNITSSL